MNKKSVLIASAATVIGAGVAVGMAKKDKKSGNSRPNSRPIEKVGSSDVGFEDYGYKKSFNIDKNRHISVLITGAGSYIGESFKQYCEEHYPNISITAIDMVDGSWRNHPFTDDKGKPYDTVFHVAGIAHADVGHTSLEDQEKYYKVNTDLAVECCQKAKDAGCSQFIFMSSMIIYGGAEYVDEHTLPNPTNFYGNSKWLADKGVRGLENDYFKVAVLRPPMIYGKGSKGNYPTLSKIGRTVPVFPTIENKRSMLYIENLCEFVAQLAMSGSSGIFFPQNAEYSNTAEMVKAIAAVNGKRMKESNILNLGVIIAQHVPGSIGGLANKAFGSSYYDQGLSKYYGLDYQKVGLDESIRRTEGTEEDELSSNNSDDSPLVSVITAAYNCEKTIGETIESVQSQTHTNWEMLIVNDCSTDNTVDVVKSYAENDSRIILINLETNSGAAKARNTAIENAHGRFLAILDSDDLWKKDKLKSQIGFMLDNNYGFTFTSYETFHDSADAKRTLFKAPKKITYKQYLRNTIIGNLTVVIDKEKIPDFFIVKGHLEDVLTWMHFLNKGYIAYGLDKNLASYRVAAASKSGNKFRNAKRYYECLKEQPISAAERVR